MKIEKHCGCRWPDVEIRKGIVYCSYCAEPATIRTDDAPADAMSAWSYCPEYMDCEEKQAG